MPTYNPQIYDEYINNRDYFGAAEYLSTCSAKDGKSQDIVNHQIEELSRQGSIQQSMLEKGDVYNQDAFHFISAIDGTGTIPHKKNPEDVGNTYGDLYLGYINTLHAAKGNVSPGGRNVGGEQINRIRLEFNNTSAYKQYLDTLGINYDDVVDLGVNTSRDNKTGHTFVDIPTSNKQLIKLINAVGSLNVPFRHNAMGTTGSGFYPQSVENVSVKGLTISNIIIPRDKFNYSNIIKAGQLINDARALQQQLQDKSKSVTTLEDIVITPYLGQGQANAHKDLNRGIIDEDQYKKISERITNEYDKLLMLHDLQKFDVYLSTEADSKIEKEFDFEGNVLQLVEAKDKANIKRIIEVAIKDKRLTYAAALKNGELGTYITIGQKVNEKGEPVKGEYGQNMRLFVPGLFKSSCDEAFNADTKQMAVRDNADMKRWNYGKFTKDGEYIGYNKEIGSYIQKNVDGQAVKVPINEAQMLQLLNKDRIVTQSVSKLLNVIGENGQPIEHFENGKLVPYNIEQQAQVLSAIGANEAYPKGQYTDGERLQGQVEMYQLIMKLLSKQYKARQAEK